MPRIPAAERPRLTLEDYIVFFTTRGGKGLSLRQLNEIIYMHAFARLHRVPKPAMVDALRSVELMRPRRSTVPLNATAPPPSAAAERGRRALRGRGHARHRGPRLARVPRRLPPLRPRRGAVARRRRNPRAHLRHRPHLPAEPAQRLVAPAPRAAGSGQEEALPDGQGEGRDQDEAAARGGAAHAPVRRDGHLRVVRRCRHRVSGKFEAHLWDRHARSPAKNKKGKQVYLGAFDSEEAAAHTYDLAALKYWGSDCKLNFTLRALPLPDAGRFEDDIETLFDAPGSAGPGQGEVVHVQLPDSVEPDASGADAVSYAAATISSLASGRWW